MPKINITSLDSDNELRPTTPESFSRTPSTPPLPMHGGRNPRKRLLVSAAAGLALLLAAYGTAFFWPRQVTFSFAGDTCIVNPVLLPRLATDRSSQGYTASLPASVSIGNYPMYSHRTCVTPTKAPQQNHIETLRLGAGPVTKNLRITTAGLPSFSNQTILDKPLSTGDPLAIRLSTADRVFTYRLKAAAKSTACTTSSGGIACDVAALALAQSTTYDVSLERLFQGKPAGTIFARQLKTVETVTVVSGSITADQTIFTPITEFNLTLNRAATAHSGAHLFQLVGDKRTEVPATTMLSGTTLTIKAAAPLPRSASFVYTLDRVTAADGGYLPAAYSLAFRTSGGPKTTGTNIGTTRVSPSSAIVITFDSPVLAGQSLKDFIRLEAGGAAVAADITASGSSVTIRPASALPRCAALTLRVVDGLQNIHGVAGNSAWSYRSRTLCQTVFSIGTSVQGRAITAYSFGSGPSRIVYVGTTHGDETSSTHTMNSWVEYLETNGPSIPAHRTIVVIPNLNPDAYAANRRTNASNVDLNRNFPSNDWKSSVTMPDKSVNPTGGGTAPLSEPESKALANYITATSPRLVLTYHAIAGVVIPNGSGDSAALGQLYDQKSNLYYQPLGQTTTIFEYDTTGAFEDWLHDKQGIPALLIELWTRSSNEFSKNQNAMWTMVQLP